MNQVIITKVFDNHKIRTIKAIRTLNPSYNPLVVAKAAVDAVGAGATLTIDTDLPIAQIHSQLSKCCEYVIRRDNYSRDNYSINKVKTALECLPREMTVGEVLDFLTKVSPGEDTFEDEPLIIEEI